MLDPNRKDIEINITWLKICKDIQIEIKQYIIINNNNNFIVIR